MRKTNGPGGCQNDSSNSSKKTKPRILTQAQHDLLEFACPLDAPHLAKSLKLLHDTALYHAHGIIDEPEKDALHTAKLLWEHLEAIKE